MPSTSWVRPMSFVMGMREPVLPHAMHVPSACCLIQGDLQCSQMYSEITWKPPSSSSIFSWIVFLAGGVLSHLGSHSEDLGGLRMEKEGLLALFELALQRRAVTRGNAGKQGVVRLFFNDLGAEKNRRRTR